MLSLVFSVLICCQVYENGKLYSAKVADKIIRILPEDYEREKYRRRQGEVKTVIHWGQRKLLLSEIEFLTKFTLEEEEHRALYKRFVEGRWNSEPMVEIV